MLLALLRALAQLREPALRRVLLLSIAVAIVTFAALWTSIAWALANTAVSSIGWINTLVQWAGQAAAFVLAIVFFPAAVTAIQSGFFSERVVAAVEAKHYPGLPSPRAPSWREQLGVVARFLPLALALNLLALPFYLVPVINAVVFISLNGYLLARENFEAIALRRMPLDAARRLWKRRRLRFWLTGAVFALLAAVPIVNLVAAIFAAATTTHLVEAARNEPVDARA